MKRCFYCLILIIPFFLPGCATNIKNISADYNPTESIIVGRIETVPSFWDFSLYEEGSKTEDQIEIAGMGFGLTRASKLQNQGFLFKIVRPGTYILRLKKVIGGEYAQDNILRFRVPEGRLVYFGTIKVVEEGRPSQNLLPEISDTAKGQQATHWATGRLSWWSSHR